MSKDFARTLAALCNAHKERTEEIIRLTMLDLFAQCVDMSPVGNPDLWKDNSGVMKARGEYLDAAMAFNEANPGKRRMGTSAATVKKKFPLLAGKGYVGGRFKSNWQVGIGALNTTVVEEARASGSGALARAKQGMVSYRIGNVIFIGNNLPYSKRLEYGWSTQAPGGMVRLTLQNTQEALKRAVAATAKK